MENTSLLVHVLSEASGASNMQLLVMSLGSQSFHRNSYSGSITVQASHYPLVRKLLPCRRTIIYFFLSPCTGQACCWAQSRKRLASSGKRTVSLYNFTTPFISALSYGRAIWHQSLGSDELSLFLFAFAAISCYPMPHAYFRSPLPSQLCRQKWNM